MGTNLATITVSSSCNIGPFKNTSFNDSPESDLHDPSNTTQNLVVRL